MRFSSTRRAFLLSSGAACCARRADALQEPVFSTEVKVVNVLATVRDKKGAIVANLGQDDFSIAEDSHPQAVRYFARETDLPLTIGLMVDTSASQRGVLDAERGASFRFLDQVLRENKDQVFIMQFDSAVQLRQTLTSSRRQLNDSLSYVDTETESQLRLQNGGGTLLYDAVYLAAHDKLQSQAGRKILVLLTDGGDQGSQETLKSAEEAAQKANTILYVILIADHPFTDTFGTSYSGKAQMEQLARDTGGRVIDVGNNGHKLEDAFDQIQNELRTQYLLSYTPANKQADGKYRKLEIDCGKGLTVQARKGYYAIVGDEDNPN